MELKKNRIIRVLRYFDSLICEDLEIIICGGAACILRLGFERGTQDIDVITSIPRISLYTVELKKVATKYGLMENWLNDSAKGYMDMLPSDFPSRLQSLDLSLRHLKISVLSPVDIYIMKLAAFRPADILDITLIPLSNEDIGIIQSSIERISNFNVKRALRMRLYLEEKNLWKK